MVWGLTEGAGGGLDKGGQRGKFCNNSNRITSIKKKKKRKEAKGKTKTS